MSASCTCYSTVLCIASLLSASWIVFCEESVMNSKDLLLFTATCVECNSECNTECNTQSVTLDSSVEIVTSYQLDNLGFKSRQVQVILFFPKPSTPTVEPTQSLIQRLTGPCTRAKAAGTWRWSFSHLVLRLKMNEFTPPLTLYDTIA